MFSLLVKHCPIFTTSKVSHVLFEAMTWLSASCHFLQPAGSLYRIWHQTICHPSYFSPSCLESDENKSCKHNEGSILWLLVGIWLHLISCEWRKWRHVFVLCLVVSPCLSGRDILLGDFALGWHLAAEGKGLLGVLRREGNWICVQLTSAGRPRWHVSETGCIVGSGGQGGFL